MRKFKVVYQSMSAFYELGDEEITPGELKRLKAAIADAPDDEKPGHGQEAQ